jgi:hypothetical protein
MCPEVTHAKGTTELQCGQGEADLRIGCTAIEEADGVGAAAEGPRLVASAVRRPRAKASEDCTSTGIKRITLDN